ncbi:MAG: hypothetical protein EXR11_12280 [Rhodospirillaceae bacterium]|nr:hypothetical protein [Rhodospirillaceae bacterium]
MLAIIGIVIVMTMVFGGYMLHGGHLSVIIEALPTELMVIFGGAMGAMVIGNSAEVLKGITGNLKKVFSGPKWTEQDFKDVLCGLTVKMSAWEHRFPHAKVGSPNAKEDFLLTEIRPGLSGLVDLARGQASVVGYT